MSSIPARLVSVPEMIAIEQEADRSGLSYAVMMENAGLGLARVVDERYQYLKPGPVLGLVGSGNNGGDTLVALAHLADWGWQVQAYIARPRQAEDPLILRVQQGGGLLVDGVNDLQFAHLEFLLGGCLLLLDGVLGTGIRLPLHGPIAELLQRTGDTLQKLETSPVVVAVDCPSGVDSDSGDAAPQCFEADLTVTMAAMKIGLLKFPAYNFVGDIELVGIGLNADIQSWRSIPRFVVDEAYVTGRLPARQLDAHKGTFGTALVVAGSISYTGAALLAGQAAYRSGAGLVTLAVPEPLYAAIAGQFVEATWITLPHENGGVAASAADVILDNLERPTSILLGPGFGLAEGTRDFLDRLLNVDTISRFPGMVLDADGLKLVASLPEWPVRLPPGSILTPHPGEMSVLCGLPTQEIQSDRLGVAEKFAHQWGHVLVLKGAFTVIASPKGQTAVIPVATPALARAGTGDVLAGLIAGFRAQGLDGFDAAVAGAWIHAQAGLHAAGVLGSTAAVLAGDVLQALVDVMADLSA